MGFAVHLRPACRRACASLGLALGLLLATPAAGAGDFEIVKITADKVWRLDKRTGEISVCSLGEFQPVCVPAKETASQATLIKRNRAYYVARRPLRSIVVVRPAHGHKARKWR
jgi:hypothetical protein